MKLEIGFTLATVFLGLFTVALWKKRNRKEGSNDNQERFRNDREAEAEYVYPAA